MCKFKINTQFKRGKKNEKANSYWNVHTRSDCPESLPIKTVQQNLGVLCDHSQQIFLGVPLCDFNLPEKS